MTILRILAFALLAATAAAAEAPLIPRNVLFGNPEGGRQRGTIDAGFRSAVLRIPFDGGAACERLPQYLCPRAAFGAFGNESACFEDHKLLQLDSLNTLNAMLRRCASAAAAAASSRLARRRAQ